MPKTETKMSDIPRLEEFLLEHFPLELSDGDNVVEKAIDLLMKMKRRFILQGTPWL